MKTISFVSVVTNRLDTFYSYLGRSLPNAEDSNAKKSTKKDEKCRETAHGTKSAVKKTPTNSRTGSGPGSMMRRVRSAPHHVRNAATPASAGSDYDADESDR